MREGREEEEGEVEKRARGGQQEDGAPAGRENAKAEARAKQGTKWTQRRKRQSEKPVDKHLSSRRRSSIIYIAVPYEQTRAGVVVEPSRMHFTTQGKKTAWSLLPPLRLLPLRPPMRNAPRREDDDEQTDNASAEVAAVVVDRLPESPPAAG